LEVSRFAVDGVKGSQLKKLPGSPGANPIHAIPGSAETRVKKANPAEIRAGEARLQNICSGGFAAHFRLISVTVDNRRRSDGKRMGKGWEKDGKGWKNAGLRNCGIGGNLIRKRPGGFHPGLYLKLEASSCEF
jgi:hypothetical protein